MYNYMVEVDNVESSQDVEIEVSGNIVWINQIIFPFIYLLLQAMTWKAYFLIIWMNFYFNFPQSLLCAKRLPLQNLIKKDLRLKQWGNY